MQIKPCTQCQTPFTDTSNNQKRYCPACATERRHLAQRKYAEKRKEKDRIPDPNKIQCLICLKYYKKPMSHAWQVHGTTAREYKDNFDLEQKGLIPEHDREILRQHIKDNFDLVVKRNLITNPKSQAHRFTHNHTRTYTRKPPTLARLKQHALTTLKRDKTSRTKK